jgi:hypothetical protein
MESLIYTKENAINKQFCKKLIDKFEKKYIGEIINDNCILKLNNKFIEIETEIKDVLKTEIDNYIQIYDKFIINKKYKKDVYVTQICIQKINKDTINNYNLFYPMKNQFITFIIYLNTITTDERVCDDIFFDNTYISPIEGKLVLFPSDWTFPYKHNCSLLEDKYILKGEFALLPNN